jgi:subtilisin family serine protease
MRTAAAVVAAAVALAVAPAGSAAPSFAPNDPLASRQWYLAADHAFDFWPAPPILPPLKDAIVDSGIDGGHPEFAGRIAAAKSFVSGSPSPLVDTEGHGTFVAGLIGAALNNAQGIAGIAFSSQLVIAKAVGTGGIALIASETAAIRWAVDQGARVINISLAGLRDPRDPHRDTYSEFEQQAIDYATRHGALVVAAVGNGDEAPSQPWPYASYPAALPHVVGVAAYGPLGAVPAFSDRDAVFDDVGAPGQTILSTFPRALTAKFPACGEQGYSSCGPSAYRRGDGTSFSAPQVTATAALLFALNPGLRPEQVSTLIERSAVDASAANGCSACRRGRDPLTGWGKLDIAAALGATARTLPPPDALEPNDDAGARAVAIPGRRVNATLDFWDDPRDVYAVRLKRGARLVARLTSTGIRPGLVLWKPRTATVVTSRGGRLIAAHGASRILYRAPAAGVYYLEVRLRRPGTARYTLSR